MASEQWLGYQENKTMEQSYVKLGAGNAMSKAEMDSFLEQKLVARFTSIRSDGYPHTTPLWYVWDGEALWFVIGAGGTPQATYSQSGAESEALRGD
jgi:hypothetical protein